MCKNPQTLLSQLPEGEDSRRRACPYSELPLWKGRRSPGVAVAEAVEQHVLEAAHRGGHASLSPNPGSSGCALPFDGQHWSAQELHLAVLMPLLVCSPSPSCFLKPTPFPTGCQAAGRKLGCGRCCATARLAQHIPPWQCHKGTCEA